MRVRPKASSGTIGDGSLEEAAMTNTGVARVSGTKARFFYRPG